MTDVTTCVSLADTGLRAGSQSQRTMYHMISLREMSRIGKFMQRADCGLPTTEEAAEKRARSANGYRISFQGNEHVLKLIAVMVGQLCEYTKID